MDRIVAQWEQSPDAPSTLAVCDRYPEVREDHALIVKFAYEEFRLRVKRGEELNRQAFCQQFAGCEHAVGRMLSVHTAMEQHPSWLAELTQQLEGGADESWPAAGEEFLRFSIIREIGRGGLARVYLAQEQVVGNRLVVLKVSIRDSGEARIMGRLQHPGIMPIHQVDFESLSGLHVVVMPFLGTTTLYDILNAAFPNRKGPVPSDAKFMRQLAEDGRGGLETSVLAGQSLFDATDGSYLEAVLELGIQLAEALTYTHERGVLHRDLKPSNILVTPQGLALLMDFNLSARTDGPGLLVGGTIPYMPPELLTALSGSESVRLASNLPPFGSTWNTISTEECVTNDVRTDSTQGEFSGWIACADPRSDLFSWGVIIYEMLTGQLPFGEPDVRQPVNWQAEWVLKRQLDCSIERHSANQHVPAGLFEILRQCLSVDPDARPACAAQVVAELRRLRQTASVTAEDAGNSPPQPDVPDSSQLPTELAPAKATIRPEAASRSASVVWRNGWFRVAAAAAVAVTGLAFWVLVSASPGHSVSVSNSDDAGFLFESAKKLCHDSKWTEALWRLQRANRLGDHSGFNYALQAYCLLQENNVQGGSDLGRSAIEADFATAPVLNNYGYALLKNRRLEKARDALTKALAKAPNEAVIHHNLAILNLAEQEHTKAVEHMRRALGLPHVDSYEICRDAALIFTASAQPGSKLEQDAVKYLEVAINAGLDPKTLASGTANIDRILSLVNEKHLRDLGTRRVKSPNSRLMYPLKQAAPSLVAYQT